MRLKQTGFTLVEQLIVIALIVAVLGFGAVRMMGVYHQNSFSHAEKMVVSALRFLQMKSIQDGIIYELSLNEQGSKFVIKRQVRGERELKPFKVGWLQAFQVGHSLRLNFEREKNLYFYPDGTTSKNSISIATDSGEKIIVSLKNRIGSIDIKKSL